MTVFVFARSNDCRCSWLKTSTWFIAVFRVFYSQFFCVPYLDTRVLSCFALPWDKRCCPELFHTFLARPVERKRYSVEPEDSLRPLCKVVVYSRSWVRNSVSTTVQNRFTGCDLDGFQRLRHLHAMWEYLCQIRVLGVVSLIIHVTQVRRVSW